MEVVKERERIEQVKREKEKEIERSKVFDNMKVVAEERRESFLSIMEVKDRKIKLVEKKLVREREVKRESLRLIASAKEDRVRRAKKADAFERTILQERLEENEDKQREIKASREAMLKERKRMQRQSQIERAQMKDSLEQLKTYGGRPDDALMALLGGEEMLTSSMNASQDVDASSSPMDAQMLQDGRVGQSQSLPDIGVRPGSREAAAQQAYDDHMDQQAQASMDPYGGYVSPPRNLPLRCLMISCINTYDRIFLAERLLVVTGRAAGTVGDRCALNTAGGSTQAAERGAAGEPKATDWCISHRLVPESAEPTDQA